MAERVEKPLGKPLRGVLHRPGTDAKLARDGRPGQAGRDHRGASWGKGRSTYYCASVKSMLSIYANAHNSKAQNALNGFMR